MQRALLRLADRGGERGVQRAPLLRARVLAGGGRQQWMSRVHAVAVGAQQAGVERVLDGRRVADRLQHVDVQSLAERGGEQQPARRARQARHPCPSMSSMAAGTGSSASASGRPCSASTRPTSSANSGLPSVASTIRLSSGAGRRRPSRSARRRRVAFALSAPTWIRSRSRRSSACSSADAVPGRRASRNPTGSAASRRAANASASADGGSSH